MNYSRAVVIPNYLAGVYMYIRYLFLLNYIHVLMINFSTQRLCILLTSAGGISDRNLPVNMSLHLALCIKETKEKNVMIETILKQIIK